MKRSLDKGAPSSLATMRNGYLQRLTQTQYGLDRRMHTLRLPRPYLLHHITPTLASVASLATARLSAIDTTKPARLVRKRNTHSLSRVMDPDICIALLTLRTHRLLVAVQMRQSSSIFPGRPGVNGVHLHLLAMLESLGSFTTTSLVPVVSPKCLAAI